jgi:cell division protein FtsZ
VEAAKEALASPLLDVSVEGAKGVLFNIAGGSNFTLFEVNGAADVIRQNVDPEANVIFGVVLDTNMGNEVRLTLIATGFSADYALIENSMKRQLLNMIKEGKKSDEELAIPTFMRQRRILPGQRAQQQASPASFH